MPPLIPDQELIDDEDYDSAEDEDFNLDNIRDDSDLSSASEAEDKVTGPAKKKRKTALKSDSQKPQADEEALDSGDEATVRKAEEKRQKKRKGKAKGNAGGKVDEEDDDEDDVDFGDEDEGGPGGFVKTRAMRMKMQEEPKPLAKIEGATVDVDMLWNKMNDPNADLTPAPLQTGQKDKEGEKDTTARQNQDRETGPQNKETKATKDEKEPIQQQPQIPTEMVKIRRTYKFAGDVTTEEKMVPKDSAEAKLYFTSGGNAEAVTDADVERAANAKSALKLRRPLRKISRFDPNPTGSIKKSWEKQPVAATDTGAENARGPKINTVEKSRLDWAAYVDQAGIKDELRSHSKAKEGYLNRMDFLDRVDSKKEDERRSVRLRGL